MKNLLYLSLIIVLLVGACKPEPPEPEGTDVEPTVLSLDVSATFEGELVEIFQNYENHNGYAMNFEDLRMYIAEISLIKPGGELVEVSPIEYFKFEGEALSRTYEIEPGDYEGLVYHVGVPQERNGTDDPDFLTSQYGPLSPLNVQNGMYWSWNNGYRFLIYEGRIDGTPDDSTDFPSVFAIHLGKDQFYTDMMVDIPFTVTEGSTKHVEIEWDLAKNQYGDADAIDLSIPEESLYHGAELELAARFQALMQDALIHSVY